MRSDKKGYIGCVDGKYRLVHLPGRRIQVAIGDDELG